jgi:hypothetical protein
MTIKAKRKWNLFTFSYYKQKIIYYENFNLSWGYCKKVFMG